jgi:hypothetical protein
MVDANQIRERMEIVSSDDRHVGSVEQVLGGEIELAERDIEAMVRHRRIPVSWVADVDAQVHLNCTREAAQALWH